MIAFLKAIGSQDEPERLKAQASGTAALVNPLTARIQYVGENWKALAEKLSTFTAGADGNRKPHWLKAIAKGARAESESERLVLDLKKYLANRLRREEPMNLVKAYMLCLIDEVAAVVDTDSANPYVVPTTMSESTAELEGESPVENLGCNVDTERQLRCGGQWLSCRACRIPSIYVKAPKVAPPPGPALRSSQTGALTQLNRYPC